MNDKQSNENNDLISCEAQTQSSDSDGQSERQSEDTACVTFPSLLRPNCTFPTELFYTLSPISMSQITSESTPIGPNRREPIGGEDLIQQALQTPILTSFTVHSSDSNPEEAVPIAGPSNRTTTLVGVERPPLIGRTNSSSESSQSVVSSRRQLNHTSVRRPELSEVEKDSLANRVRQLLGKTKRQSSDEDVESLGLIHTMNDSFDDIDSQLTAESERSEPDGKGKPRSTTQTSQRIVHYSSSESETEDKDSDEEDATKQTVNSKYSNSRFQNIDQHFNQIRSRSYSASGRTLHKKTAHDISSILRQSIKAKNFPNKENIETQTNRSFLAEQAVHNQQSTEVKQSIDSSKAIQTSDSLLNFAVLEKKKQVRETSCQTNNSMDVSSFLRQLLKRQQRSHKISVGTQTIRSYLTEQALKRKKDSETKQQNKERRETPHYTKAIQTSYTSSHNSESESTVIEEKWRSAGRLTNEKQPVSWFIPIDNKTQNRNISRITKTFGRSERQKAKTYHLRVSSTPLPLQEAFNQNCVEMKTNSQIRVNRINTIAELRKRTADERLIEMAKQFVRQQEASKVVKTKVIQPVFKSTIKRFFTHEEMRAQTERIYNNLPEVKAMREKKKLKERQKNQRLLAQIYKYRIKDNALKGRLTWKITQSCLN